MLIPFAGTDESLRPLSQPRAERRAIIAREMARVAKASESHLPLDQRRQVMLVQAEQVEHTAGPTWQQRMRIAAVLVIGLPVAICAAYAIAASVTHIADRFGSTFLAF